MLIDQNELYQYLRCPASGAELKRVGSNLVVDNGSSDLSYKIVNNIPILVDYGAEHVVSDESSDFQTLSSPNGHNRLNHALRSLVTPSLKTTQNNVQQLIAEIKTGKSEARVLIVGGRTVGQGMQSLYDDPGISLVAFDHKYSEQIQFLADAHQIPLADGRFDAVVIQAVLEHVLHPESVVAEVFRVLKDNGLVYAETPFIQHVHEGAFDFTRYTPSGHRYLFRNFICVQQGVSSGAGSQLLWSLEYFFRGVFRSSRAGKVIKLCLFWLRYFDGWIPEAYNSDAACGVFFLGRKSKIRVGAKEIVSGYQGAEKFRVKEKFKKMA